ncbi:hypothetical protein PRIPAC_77765 [Pristionchus pacificus]|uniref:C-type lectin n=1 Tax=Pristionchus pacificus TaxID=54126 RepID=A0A2A6CLU1_PRIPA|nr:hypothetical protein PRIPAC_77765 [Pristionchus pacificus]|eukprot:PDM79023.1 C-type lectin [Pristionchus pacificus]
MNCFCPPSTLCGSSDGSEPTLRCFKPATEPASFDRALLNCANESMEMATIHNKNDASLLILSTVKGLPRWFGLRHEYNGFHWSDEEQHSYSNWAAHEPELEKNQNCAYALKGTAKKIEWYFFSPCWIAGSKSHPLTLPPVQNKPFCPSFNHATTHTSNSQVDRPLIVDCSRSPATVIFLSTTHVLQPLVQQKSTAPKKNLPNIGVSQAKSDKSWDENTIVLDKYTSALRICPIWMQVEKSDISMKRTVWKALLMLHLPTRSGSLHNPHLFVTICSSESNDGDEKENNK